MTLVQILLIVAVKFIGGLFLGRVYYRERAQKAERETMALRDENALLIDELGPIRAKAMRERRERKAELRRGMLKRTLPPPLATIPSERLRIYGTRREASRGAREEAREAGQQVRRIGRNYGAGNTGPKGPPHGPFLGG